jgi:hypothetical protein
MERPRIADGEDGLQIRKVDVNVLNKQKRTDNSGWYSILGVERRANNSTPLKIQHVTKCYTGPRNFVTTYKKENRYFKDVGWEGIDWIHLARDRYQRQAIVNTLMNFRIP